MLHNPFDRPYGIYLQKHVFLFYYANRIGNMGTLSQITKYSGDELKGSIVRLRSDRGFESRNSRLFWCHLGHFLPDHGGGQKPTRRDFETPEYELGRLPKSLRSGLADAHVDDHERC